MMNPDVQVLEYKFGEADGVPNNPRLPLLIYPQAVKFSGEKAALEFERLFPNGGWYAAWRYGVYPFPHYHSTAHEVLGVYRGTARLRLGHTAGITIEVRAGDAIVIPAGVGHENLGASGDFHVVGGYPVGQEADLLRGVDGERPAADRRIAGVALPKGDPIFGIKGHLKECWGM
jgi:uncharacterized protein YjlB